MKLMYIGLRTSTKEERQSLAAKYKTKGYNVSHITTHRSGDRLPRNGIFKVTI